MVDHVKKLLLNESGARGLRRVSDPPSDAVMALFGVTGEDPVRDSGTVDRLMPLAMAPDLSRFRRFYDQRTTPPLSESVYWQPADALSPSGLYGRVLGYDGWWRVSALFQHADPGIYAVLSELRDCATSADAPYALGAVLLAVAYRRLVLQGGGG